ncbi:MAG TPA: hypothetical protein VNN80_18950 [Polyangiaceae bacterium]|nr:hypothetical protein [Polyangiaceae bacterium]
MRVWNQLREKYLSVDLRVLGVLRVGYGLVLLCDLVRRAQVLELFYSNDGVLSNHYVMFSPQDAFQFSLLDAFSTPAEVRVAFGLMALVYALLTLGWHTRLAQVLALLALASSNARNLFAEDDGVAALIALGVWTLFLPLGARYSLDALLQEARLPHAAARVRWRQRLLQTPFVSLAVLAASLQLLAICWLSAAHQVGATWQSGEAVHYLLWQRRLVTGFGSWLAQHEPSWLSPLATYAALGGAWALPVLALAPIGRWPRVLALVLALALHAGSVAIVTHGPPSSALLLFVLLRCPASTLEALFRRLPARVRRRWARRRGRAVRWLSRLRALRQPTAISRRGPELQGAWTRHLREALVVVFLFVSLGDLGARASASPLHLPRPRWARSLSGHLRFFQRWGAFAPDVPVEDGAGVIDALTQSGRHVDPFTGQPPRFDALERSALGGVAADYLFELQKDDNRRYRQELTRWLQGWHEREGRTPDDRIARYELWWLSQPSPPPGSTEPGAIRRAQVMRWSGEH